MGKELNRYLRRFPGTIGPGDFGVLNGVSQSEFATVNRFVVDLCVNLQIQSYILTFIESLEVAQAIIAWS